MITKSAVHSTPVTLRPICAEDRDFLFQLFTILKIEQLGAWDWEAEQRDSLMEMQFKAHEKHMRHVFPGSLDQLVMWNGQPAGRVIVGKLPGSYYLADIVLLPEFRSQGIGSHIVTDLQETGRQASLPITLIVFKNSPAVRFYRRLHFRINDENDTQFRMIWEPDCASGMCGLSNT